MKCSVSKLCSGMLLGWCLFVILIMGSQATGQPVRRDIPTVISAEILPDRQVTFRIAAPQANNVRFASSDIFNLGPKAQMTKNDSGVWETTVGPLEPKAYRIEFAPQLFQ